MEEDGADGVAWCNVCPTPGGSAVVFICEKDRWTNWNRVPVANHDSFSLYCVGSTVCVFDVPCANLVQELPRVGGRGNFFDFSATECERLWLASLSTPFLF